MQHPVDTEITSVRPLRPRTGYYIRIELGHERVYNKNEQKKEQQISAREEKNKLHKLLYLAFLFANANNPLNGDNSISRQRQPRYY